MTFRKLGDDFISIIIPHILRTEYNIDMDKLYTEKELSKLSKSFQIIRSYSAVDFKRPKELSKLNKDSQTIRYYSAVDSRKIGKDLTSLYCGITWLSIVHTYLQVIENDKIFVGSGKDFIINTDKIALDFTKNLLDVIENFEYPNEQIIKHLNYLFGSGKQMYDLSEHECVYLDNLIHLLYQPDFDGIVDSRKTTKTILL